MLAQPAPAFTRANRPTTPPRLEFAPNRQNVLLLRREGELGAVGDPSHRAGDVHILIDDVEARRIGRYPAAEKARTLALPVVAHLLVRAREADDERALHQSLQVQGDVEPSGDPLESRLDPDHLVHSGAALHDPRESRIDRPCNVAEGKPPFQRGGDRQ